jgi:hypothetical protein
MERTAATDLETWGENPILRADVIPQIHQRIIGKGQIVHVLDQFPLRVDHDLPIFSEQDAGNPFHFRQIEINLDHFLQGALAFPGNDDVDKRESY